MLESKLSEELFSFVSVWKFLMQEEGFHPNPNFLRNFFLACVWNFSREKGGEQIQKKN